MSILITHIFSALGSLFLGYFNFCFIKYRNIYLSAVLTICLFVAAITGVFLNMNHLSPFHLLSAVVVTTMTYAIYEYTNKKDLEIFNNQIWPNFLGLNLAFVGAFYPERYMGGKFWGNIETFFGLNPDSSFVFFWIILTFAIMIVIYLFAKEKISLIKKAV